MLLKNQRSNNCGGGVWRGFGRRKAQRTMRSSAKAAVARSLWPLTTWLTDHRRAQRRPRSTRRSTAISPGTKCSARTAVIGRSRYRFELAQLWSTLPTSVLAPTTRAIACVIAPSAQLRLRGALAALCRSPQPLATRAHKTAVFSRLVPAADLRKAE
jgi:hypothetical protein